MKMVAEQGLDPVEIHWFDATGCFVDQSYESQTPLYEYKPPFQRCMVCWEGSSKNHQRMRMWLLMAGDDPEEGIILTVWRQPANHRPVGSPAMVYIVDGGQIRYGPMDEGVTMEREYAEMILGFLSAWYDSLSRRSEAYVPVMRDTFTNRRKIAQGKTPSYEWRTVFIEPAKPKSESKGGTHASPRLHDRRGHLRRLRNGKNVWVRACKVGSAANGTVFHDYAVRAA